MRIVVLAVLTVAALAGCGPDLDAAALAAAKCSGALHGELGLAENEHVETSDVLVTGDDAERQVSGRWTEAGSGDGEFTCVVVPDASDELRGLRVTDLSVQRRG
jgi:hypothetical protein